MLTFFEQYPHIAAYFSDKTEGNMSPVKEREGNEDNVRTRRFNWLSRLDIDPKKCMHISPQNKADTECIAGMDDLVRVCGGPRSHMASPKIDAVFTSQDQLYVTMPVGDCALLYVYDQQYGIVGLIHAGWHGLNKQIVTYALNCMKEKWGIPNLSNTYIEVSPYFHWYKKLFRDVLSEHIRALWYTNRALTFNEREYIFDIQTMIEAQVVNAGGKLTNCDFTKAQDTFTNEAYWSHREYYMDQRNDLAGLNLGVIGKRL